MYVVNLTVAVGTKVDAFILLLFVELEAVAAENAVYPVSYTHLTLPTKA